MMEYNPNFVGGSGPPDATFAIVGEAPGQEEDEEIKNWIGRAGKLMREMVNATGYNVNNAYLSNVEKYRPPNNKLSLYKTVGRKPMQDVNILWNEIDAIHPNSILALGEHALKALTGKKGIKKWRGSILTTTRYPDIKVIPSYHTSALLRSETSETKAFSYSARAYMQLDFKRAVDQSKFRELRLPKRQLEYASNADQAERFFYLYRNFKRVSVDIETTKGTCIPTCIGFAFNAHHGMSIPLLNIDSRTAIDDKEQVKLWHIVQRILGDPSIEIIGQNFKFDWKKLAITCGFHIRAKLWFDTGMAAHILYPEFPKAMQFLTSVWTEEPYYKDELKEYDPDKEDFHSILLYNAKDVCVPFEIHTKMLSELEERHLDKFFFDDIMPLSHFYMNMENRGMAFDIDIRDEIVEQYKILEKELEENLRMTIGYELQLGSYQKVRKLIFDELGIPARKNTKDDTLVEVLAIHCRDDTRKYSIISDILELRKVRRTLNGPLASPPDYDGRMRTIYNPNGAANGRSSSNLVKPPERPTQLGLQMQNMTKHGEIGPEMRAMLTADKGKILFQLDMSQAESRVCAALAKDMWLLDVFRLGKDIHSITASWYFDKENPESDMDPIGVDPVGERFIGKSTRHGLTYFMQWKKLMSTINKLARKFGIPLTVSASECKIFRNIFLRKSPKIEAIFWKEVLDAINKNKRTLVAASGRTRQFFGLWDPNLYYSYIPSASVTDHNKFAAMRFCKRIPQLELLKEDHDSIVGQCTESELPEFIAIGKEEYEKPMDLSRCSLPRDPIVIPCDAEVGYNYKDLKKWRK